MFDVTKCNYIKINFVVTQIYETRISDLHLYIDKLILPSAISIYKYKKFKYITFNV